MGGAFAKIYQEKNQIANLKAFAVPNCQYKYIMLKYQVF
jgi:hypothetical protein